MDIGRLTIFRMKIWVVLVLGGVHAHPAVGQSGLPDKNLKSPFEERAAFYLDQQSSVFFRDLARQEKHLLHLVRNITAELEQRGAKALVEDQIPLSAVYGHAEHLVLAYSQEIDKLLQLVEDIERLQVVMDLQDGLHLLRPLASLRQNIVKVFDDRRLFQESGVYSRRYLAFLNRQYKREVKALLKVYKRLDLLQLETGPAQEEVVQAINEQKASIAALFEVLEPVGPDSVVASYNAEVERLETLLEEISHLIVRARSENVQVSHELVALQQEIISSLDQRLVALFGYGDHGSVSAMAFELFDEWKARETAEYQVQLLRHRIVKEALLASGTRQERTRMLARDLRDALLSYADRAYEFATEQFTEVVQDYELYFFDLGSVRFYRADCYYQRKLFNLARADYEAILQHATDSKYLNETLFRLMLIAEKQGDLTAFYEYFDLFRALGIEREPEVIDKCTYLAGYVYLQDSRYADGEEVLSAIPQESKYFLHARYLTALSYVSRDNFAAAVTILEELANEKNYPWTESHAAQVRNLALLKLGTIFYEMGEYEKAIAHFDKVSPGFAEYERSLIAAAWAHLELNHYEKTLALVNVLLQEHFGAATTYEALVLAAHSKRRMNQEDGALTDLRYVTSSKAYMQAAKRFGAERRRLLVHLHELEQFEREAVQRDDEDLVRRITAQRVRLNRVLEQLQLSGGQGALLQAYLSEGDTLLDVIEEMEMVMTAVQSGGQEALTNQARKQRETLLRTLAEYENALARQKSKFVRERARPVKEIAVDYRREILTELTGGIAEERRVLQTRLQEVRALQTAARTERENLELEIVANEFAVLGKQTERLQTWLAAQTTEQGESNFQYWANVAGMGVSDITFNRMREKDGEIETLASNRDFVTRVIDKRRRVLDQRLAEYDEIIRQLEYEIQSQELERYKEENEAYFREGYFDSDESESE